MIFGTRAPKMTVSGGGTVLLDYATIQKDEADYDILKHTSEITGNVAYVTRGSRWVVDILVHLYKYADPYAKFVELIAQKGTKVKLYRHRDGSAYKNSAGAEVDFMIEEINPFYLTNTKYEDAVIMKFRSVEYVDISKSAYNIVKPVTSKVGNVTFYPNYIQYAGFSASVEPSIVGQDYISSGGQTTGAAYDLVDNKRTTQLTVKTNGEITAFEVDFDLTSGVPLNGSTSLPYAYTYIIMDNHNLKTATTSFVVRYLAGNTEITPTSAYAGSLGSALSSVSLSGNVVLSGGATGQDGVILVNHPVSLSAARNIQFGSGLATYAADVKIGEIAMGRSNLINADGQLYSYQDVSGKKRWTITWQNITDDMKSSLETAWTVQAGISRPFYIDLGEAATPKIYYVRFNQSSLNFTATGTNSWSVEIDIISEV